MPTLEKKFAAKLRRARADLHWSQNLLAKKLNVSTALIARLEKGDTLPSDDTVLRIAREMILDAADLFQMVEEDRKGQIKSRHAGPAALNPKGTGGMVGEELLGDKKLKEAVGLLESLHGRAGLADIVGEILRLFAQEAEQKGILPTSVPHVEEVPSQEREIGERIAADEELRTSYRRLKTCLANPKVGDLMMRILQTFARVHGRDK